MENVQLDVATENGTGEYAISVEDCYCPRGYSGMSCEECAPGYYRSRTYPFLGVCIPCDCNGHASTCDLYTGVCHVSTHSHFLTLQNVGLICFITKDAL